MNNLIIDGFGLAFRSHFAFINSRTSDGQLSGCVYGFLVSLRSLKKKYPDCHFSIAWDNEALRKKEQFPQYKANRASFDLSAQIKDLKVILSTVNVTQAETVGEEADDVMATLAENMAPEGMVYIYTADKDLMQLVIDGKILVINSRSGDVFDEEAVKNKYGVYPKDMACFLSLRGDVSDNIPGVPRAPSKLICSLSSKYNNPRTVYASLGEEKLTDFQTKSFSESENQIYVNYDIIKLRTDLDVKILDGTEDEEKLDLCLQKYEIKSVKAQGFLDIFNKESSFAKRTAPSIQNFSLFEEN